MSLEANSRQGPTPKYYLQVTDADFKIAANNAAQQGAKLAEIKRKTSKL